MQDIQSQPANHSVHLDKVGVRNVTYPITVMDRINRWQETVAKISMSVDLPHQFRGTHMSRFIEILNYHRGKITVRSIDDMLQQMRERFQAHCAHIEIVFPYFIEKEAPVSAERSLLEYKAAFVASNCGETDIILRVEVPVLTLCPCSKEISKYGAHSQRNDVTVQVRMNKLVWIEEIVKVVEDSASSDIFALLKRSDEKYVTERAYENPRFVEDIVREVATCLRRDRRIDWFSVLSQSHESIHNHDAFAFIEEDKRNASKKQEG